MRKVTPKCGFGVTFLMETVAIFRICGTLVKEYKRKGLICMVTLKNDVMTVSITEFGAEMQNITAADGTQYLWHGDPKYWAGRAPVLFPNCGRMFDDKYCYEGKEYTLPIHGFAKYYDFEVESATETEAVFLLRDNAETRKMYPFAFEFRVRYALDGDSIVITYDVHNPSTDKPLLASWGSHEAYVCPEGLTAYDVVFEKEEPLNSHYVGKGITHATYPVEAPDGVLPLKDEYFTIDALVFRYLQSKEISLRNRETGRGVKVNFDGIETLLIWTKPGAPYVCIEPWCGLPCWEDFDGNLENKEGIRHIAAGETCSAKHIITLLP